MVNLGTAKLAGVTMVIAILAIAGTNLAFAQQSTCGTAPYGAVAFGYIACGPPLVTAQYYGAAIVVGVIAFSWAMAIASGLRAQRAWT